MLARAPETAAGAVGGPVPGDHGADRSSEEEDWDTVDTRQVWGSDLLQRAALGATFAALRAMNAIIPKHVPNTSRTHYM